MIDRAVASELVGTALLLFVIVGSGVTVQQMEADPASSLFYHAVAVGLALAVLIALFARTSGAHFNPAVTLALWRRRSIGGQTALPYIGAQVVGAVLASRLPWPHSETDPPSPQRGVWPGAACLPNMSVQLS